MSVLGEIFRRAQLSCPKVFPFCRPSVVQKATFNPLSPNGRRGPRHLTFHPRQTAGELQVREKVQNSRSAFTGWENSICPSRVAWLPPSLGGSGLSGANFMWESLHQHGARWPLLRAYKFFPHPSATRGGSFMAPPLAKVGQKFCFMLPPPASPLSGRPPVRLKLCDCSCLSPLSSHPPVSKGE